MFEKTDLIRNKVAEYLNDLDAIELAHKSDVDYRLIKSLKNKKRTIRFFYWKKLKDYLEIDEKISLLLKEYNNYLKKLFTEYYNDYRAMSCYIIYSKIGNMEDSQIFFKEDIISETLEEIWKRFDEYDEKGEHPNATYISFTINNILSRRKKKDEKISSISKNYLLSTNFKIVADGSLEILNKISNDYLNPLIKASASILLDDIKNFLTDREFNIFFERFYIRNTLKEIGKHYDISKERVRQIGIKIKNKLKKKFSYGE